MYSRRGTKLRVFNGYKFRFHKTLASDLGRWVCTVKNCKAYTMVKNDVIREENSVHNHTDDSKLCLVLQKIAHACKRTAAKALQVRTYTRFLVWFFYIRKI